MDIKIKDKDCNFKMRVAGILLKENKLLAVDVCDNGFYCLPGGHAHIGESSNDAIKREFKEEVLVDCHDAKLVALVENFFYSKMQTNKVHEVCYFYLLDADISTKDFDRIENDEGELKSLKFKWIDIEKLKEVDFRPANLKEKIMNKNFEFEHMVVNDLNKEKDKSK